ncbi:hypothetical protein KSP39_PZI004400 [Platanthera zijinensis]|uniref:Rhodanese domain-containing protein n=1 Tax=Platanthera zijinensis TaxID=2320716 RepID=A0AAP0BW94_9ASPA
MVYGKITKGSSGLKVQQLQKKIRPYEKRKLTAAPMRKIAFGKRDQAVLLLRHCYGAEEQEAQVSKKESMLAVGINIFNNKIAGVIFICTSKLAQRDSLRKSCRSSERGREADLQVTSSIGQSKIFILVTMKKGVGLGFFKLSVPEFEHPRYAWFECQRCAPETEHRELLLPEDVTPADLTTRAETLPSSPDFRDVSCVAAGDSLLIYEVRCTPNTGDVRSLVTGAGQEAAVPSSVPVRVAHELLQAGHRYLDVRTLDEFNGGHVVGATNIPFMFTVGSASLSRGLLRPLFFYPPPALPLSWLPPPPSYHLSSPFIILSHVGPPSPFFLYPRGLLLSAAASFYPLRSLSICCDLSFLLSAAGSLSLPTRGFLSA